MNLILTATPVFAYEDRCVHVDEQGVKSRLDFSECSYSAIDAGAAALSDILRRLSETGMPAFKEIDQEYFYHPELTSLKGNPEYLQERLKTDLDGLGFFDKGEIVKIERRGDGYYKNPVFKDFQANLTVIFQIHIEYGSHDDDVWNVEMLLDGRGVSERRLYSDTGGYYPQYDYKIRSIKIAPVKKGFFLR